MKLISFEEFSQATQDDPTLATRTLTELSIQFDRPTKTIANWLEKLELRKRPKSTKTPAAMSYENDLSLEERHRLSESCRPLAAKLGRDIAIYRFGVSGDSEIANELVEEAFVALVYASKKFDPSRGFRFSTYCTTVIQSRLIRATKIEMDYQRFFCRFPQMIDEDTTYDGMIRDHRSVPALMTDAESDHFWETLGRFLTPQYKQVLEMRFRQSRTLKDIADELGLSKERIRQIERKSIAQLRKRMMSDHGVALLDLLPASQDI